MAPKMTLRTYEDYERSRGDLSGMFSVLTDAFAIDRVLYPGSYVHLSPSFVFPRVVYIDTDRRAKVYFADSLGVEALVEERKHYVEPPQITFHNVDYTTNLDEPDEGFDLLVSLYAGFVSEACKRYLRVGGWLVANNSHGDASMASIDPDYEFVATINHRSGSYRIVCKDLESYFVPKKDTKVTAELLRSTGRGIGYTKTASAYVFQRRH